ncbi:pyridoxamine 5'-phosphate oxidase family protein [Streptomyces sp. NPDC023588]|uniref:helix-turn-helix domain-containing protein n=1 Tax=Streptomyces sp. NPDC023588 TaxID=3154907 RepID=UPI0033E93C73
MGTTQSRPPTGHTDLGRRIAARREELGLTREQVGKRCGADASYIAYMEEHAASPAIGSLLRLADALGTTVAELTGATTELPPGRTTALHDVQLITLSDEECLRLLSTHGIGRIALVTPQGPAIFPVNYVMAGRDIAFRTLGDAVLARADGTEVAFEVDHIDDVTRLGWSVLAVGEAEGVIDPEELVRLDALARSLPWAGGPRTHWMRVRPARVTGRRLVER